MSKQVHRIPIRHFSNARALKQEYSALHFTCSQYHKQRYNATRIWYRTQVGNLKQVLNDNKMKNKITILIGVIMVLFTSSCKYDPTISNPEQYATIYMAQGESLREFIFQQSKGSDRILIGANYGGVDEAPEDIRVKFEIDPSLVAQYNEANQTEFEQLPMNNISFPTKEAVIQKGTLQTQALPLDIDFTGLPTFTSYLLPVNISSSSGNVSINEQLQTAYFRIEVRSDPTPIKIMMLGKGGTNNDMDKLSQIIADANPDICIIREIDKFTNRSG